MSAPLSQPQPQRPSSPWAFRLATVIGIPVRIHVTFLLFLGWLWTQGGIRGVILVSALFVCVLLHEFGHALTARRYGIGTRDITLYPIGGVAMLTGRLRARHELWVALAGPAVNLGIAGVLAVGALLTGRFVWPPTGTESFVSTLMFLNLAMAGFNLIPAFPMDGGRVLRALLARGMPDAKATSIAATVGQAIAIGFFLYGLISQEVILTLIAFFVFLGAGQETQAETTRSVLEGKTARDAMLTHFETLSHGTTLDEASQKLLAGSQADFPVVVEGEVVGVLTRVGIARGIAQDGPSAYVAGYMDRRIKIVGPLSKLDEVVELITRDDPTPLVVMDGTELIGLLTAENVSEFIMLQHALQTRLDPR